MPSTLLEKEPAGVRHVAMPAESKGGLALSIPSIVIVFLIGAAAAGIYGSGPILFLGLSTLLLVAWLDSLDGELKPKRLAYVPAC